MCCNYSSMCRNNTETRRPGCPIPRLPNLACACRLPMLSMTSQGSPWVGSQAPTLLAGVSADVGPLGGPPEIRLRAASYLPEKNQKKRSRTPCPVHPSYFVCTGSWVWILAQPMESGGNTSCTVRVITGSSWVAGALIRCSQGVLMRGAGVVGGI